VVKPRRRNVLGRVPDRVSELFQRAIGPAGLLFGDAQSGQFHEFDFRIGKKVCREECEAELNPGRILTPSWRRASLPAVEPGFQPGGSTTLREDFGLTDPLAY
jgi:hypothetical protein